MQHKDRGIKFSKVRGIRTLLTALFSWSWKGNLFLLPRILCQKFSIRERFDDWNMPYIRWRFVRNPVVYRSAVTAFV